MDPILWQFTHRVIAQLARIQVTMWCVPYQVLLYAREGKIMYRLGVGEGGQSPMEDVAYELELELG